jgi:hypothetical protein
MRESTDTLIRSLRMTYPPAILAGLLATWVSANQASRPEIDFLFPDPRQPETSRALASAETQACSQALPKLLPPEPASCPDEVSYLGRIGDGRTRAGLDEPGASSESRLN